MAELMVIELVHISIIKLHVGSFLLMC